MTPGMKMMMVEKARRESQDNRYRHDESMENRYRYDGDMENRRTRKVDIGYEETRGGYEPESRNRRRYKNGRFAPRQDGGSMEMENTMPWYDDPQRRYDWPRQEDHGMESRYRMNDEGTRMVGFDGRTKGYETTNTMGGQKGREDPQTGHAGTMSHGRKQLDQKTAKEWVQEMGECFTMEETMEALKKRKCKCEPLEFWVIVNAMKSDYPKLAAKYGVDHMDFYADMAVEWLEDRDAKPGKAMNYYNYVVKHE